jgi:hypothetical protein
MPRTKTKPLNRRQLKRAHEELRRLPAAEPDLVEAVARKLCARHGGEIFGFEAVTTEFLDQRWRSFECDARDAIALVRGADVNRHAGFGRRPPRP